MPVRNYIWFKIASGADDLFIAGSQIAVVEIKDKKICVTRFQNNWYAFSYQCPHASGILADGFIDSLGNVVCPVHHYRFSIKTGRHFGGEEFSMKIYPAEIREDGIYIGIEQPVL